VEQLELLRGRGVTFFFFSDDTFTLRRERVIDICRRIAQKRLDITWAAIARVDDVEEEMLFWMRKAGCIQISYGVESGSEAVRGALNKNLDARRIQEAFHLTQRYGILARAYFIYGCPGETMDTVRETLELIGKIRPLAAIFYILDIFPGTALYRDFMKRTGATDDIWLERIEDIMYWETDPDLSREKVLAFGERLRSSFHRDLPRYAEALDLADREDLYPMHADFLSRLAMTFTHGDYAAVEAIPDKEATAERLYERALAYHPDQRAYLGLGILKQRAGAHEEVVPLLDEATRAYPQSEQLHLCLAVSLMNLTRYAEVLQILEKFPRSSQALRFAAACHEALDDRRGRPPRS
jgi:tetratricopeptide (TPR) repeat protein